jgi:plasmid maintenance system antidote protein VapI
MKNIFLLKGLHPGIVLERELRKRKLSKGRFAISVNEFPQTLSAITAGKRNMNTTLAMRIEKALNIEEGYFMTLHIFYEIKEEKQKLGKNYHPDLSKLRSVLFWDTKMEKIDWRQQQIAIIKRVFERGNDTERDEIMRFYGKESVQIALKN